MAKKRKSKAKKPKKLTDDQIREIGDYLRGTCVETYTAIQICGHDLNDVDELEIQERVEELCEITRCETCDWWCDLDEIAENDNGDIDCDQCREDKE